MVTDGFDLIGATRRCVAMLRELSVADWTQRITDAVDGASTGGELVMAVRSHLQELERSRIALPDNVRQLANEIIREINKTGW